MSVNSVSGDGGDRTIKAYPEACCRKAVKLRCSQVESSPGLRPTSAVARDDMIGRLASTAGA